MLPLEKQVEAARAALFDLSRTLAEIATEFGISESTLRQYQQLHESTIRAEIQERQKSCQN